MPVLMPSPVFRWFVPAQNGTGLVPAVGYKAKFYAAGTATAKAIYEIDDTIYPSPSNTAVLNSQGYAEIKLGAGGYKLVVTDANDNPVYTQDNLNGDGSFGTGFCDTVIASDTSGLKDVDTTNKFTWCAGYQAKGDGGHGFFWNATSSTPDDTGYVIASTFDATKRWFRVPDEDGSVRAASFGYIGTLAQNLSNQLLAAASYASTYNKRLIIGPGSAATIGTDTSDFYVYAPYVHLEAGSMLTGTGLFTNLTFPNAIVTGTAEQHFTACQALFQTPQTNENPEWFGASMGAADNTAAFTKWFACLPFGGVFVLPPGVWNYSNTTSFPYPSAPLILLGSIHATTGSDIPTGYYGTATSRFRLNQILFNNGTKLSAFSSGAASYDGDFYLAGYLIGAQHLQGAVVESITGNVVSAADVVGKAGTSGQSFKAAGRLACVLSSASTSGTGATDLLATTLQANTLVNDGDCLRVKIQGTTSTASSGNKTITINLGSTVVASFGASTDAVHWVCVAEIFKNGANYNSFWSSSMTVSGTHTVVDIYSDSLSAAMDFTVVKALKCVGTAATGAITNTLFAVEYIPAP